MSEDFDFDKSWLKVFSMCLEDVVDEDVKNKILEGSQNLSSQTSRDEILKWTKEAMENLDNLVSEEQKYEIMTGCSCQYPRAELREFKELYAKTQNNLYMIKCKNILKFF